MKRRTRLRNYLSAPILIKLLPTYIAKDVYSLTPSWLRNHGYEAVAFDLDGTLEDHHNLQPSPKSKRLISVLMDGGIKVALVSNAHSMQRINRLKDLANLYGIHTVVVPMDVGRRAKPAPDMLLKAAQDMGVRPARAIYVGDQLLKDVLGAYNARYGGVLLVSRLGRNDNVLVKLLQRPLERGVRLFLRGVPVRVSRFPKEIYETRPR